VISTGAPCYDAGMAETEFKHCSICKRPIVFEAKYFVCSVSTCNRKRTGLFFCSVACWDAHLPEARHRDAWAEERTAPTRGEWERVRAEEDAAAEEEAAPAEPRRRIVASAPSEELPRDVLVVVSKLKAYVRARSGMNTSDTVVGVISDHLRRLCDDAIRNAARDGRRTVMDRDFAPLPREGT
jgi:histone H3/H4